MPITISTGSGDRESALDKVLKGLSIAKTTFDIGADIAKIAGPKVTDAELAKAGFRRAPLAQGPQSAPPEKGLSSGPPGTGSPVAEGPSPRYKFEGIEGEFISRKDEEDAREEIWKKMNYDQRERAIEATRINQAESRNKPTDAQAQAAGYGKRLMQAEADFAELTKSGYNRADPKAALNSALPNIAQKGDSQRQAQAERNFINAVLRRESGAAIAPSEFSNAEQQYFPRAGDSPEVIQQKERNRQQALESLRVAAGPAWEKTKTVTKADGGGFDPAKAAVAELERRRKAKGEKK